MSRHHRFRLPLMISALFMTVRLAYRQMKPHGRNHSSNIIQSASEAIITTDNTQIILQANPAAAAMFGTTVQAMQGSTLERFVPRDLRVLDLHQKMPPATEGGMHSRIMSRRATDYAITGLKANGEQFPMEGSISSLLEDNKPIYTIILRDITERKQVQDQLERSFLQLRQLSATLQTVREEERTYIARELHDDLGQLLAALRMDLTLLQKQTAPTKEAQRTLQGMDDVIVTAITSLRRIATNLRPRALDEGGLYFALQSLRTEFVKRHTIHLDLLADEADLTLDDAYSTAIYRIVQESLTNITRHAQAQKVTVALHRADGNLMISIQDDGRGIAEHDLEKTISFGLLGMRERVWSLHGNIDISGDEGTRIRITLPLMAQ